MRVMEVTLLVCMSSCVDYRMSSAVPIGCSHHSDPFLKGAVQQPG